MKFVAYLVLSMKREGEIRSEHGTGTKKLQKEGWVPFRRHYSGPVRSCGGSARLLT